MFKENAKLSYTLYVCHFLHHGNYLVAKSLATQEVECMFQSMWHVLVNTIIKCEYKLEPLV